MGNLADLIAQTGQALAGARDMYGPAPADPAWTTTDDISGGRAQVGGAGARAADWQGQAATDYTDNNTSQQQGLGATAETDQHTGPLGTAVGQAAASGREQINGVIRDTQAGTAALAPSTGTPAGQAALAEHLRANLKRAAIVLKASQARGARLAAMMGRAGGGYTPRAGGGPMPGLGATPGRHHARLAGSHLGAPAGAVLGGTPSGNGMAGFGAAKGSPTVAPPNENKIREWVQQHFGIPNSFHTGSWENAAHNNDGGWHPKGYAFDFHGTPSQMATLANWIAGNWKDQTMELIYSGPGFDSSHLIKNTVFGDCYGPDTLSGHTDHVHWAVSVPPYDFDKIADV
jgi:hypothetical protein